MNRQYADRNRRPALLQVRKPPFSFGADTPFMWNPRNPYFAVTGNMMSFIAPSFERYLVKATKDAVPLMNDPALAAEAALFISQEAVHSRMHHRHAQALVARYPGLAAIRPEIDRRFDELCADRPLKFHLAYGADIEATFTPFFNTLLRHRASLFDQGHSTVASLFMWHFVEEIEHRSTAIKIYSAVVEDPWYRLKVVPLVFAHIIRCANYVYRAFDELVPQADRIVTASHLTTGAEAWVDKFRARLPIRLGGNGKRVYPPQLHGVTASEKLKMAYRLALSQQPWHSPEHAECPPFAFHWLDEYERGRDVADWYG